MAARPTARQDGPSVELPASRQVAMMASTCNMSAGSLICLMFPPHGGKVQMTTDNAQYQGGICTI